MCGVINPGKTKTWECSGRGKKNAGSGNAAAFSACSRICHGQLFGGKCPAINGGISGGKAGQCLTFRSGVRYGTRSKA